jgi:ribosome-binding ATPase
MALQAGIVGLPNVGKSTLFNALTAAGADSANYPFCTIDPNVGVVEVPDGRLQRLRDRVESKKLLPAVVEIVDIAGLVRGASKGEGLGNRFLGNIRAVDAILHVVRCFDDSEITHVDGGVDPLRDIETIDTELLLADLESATKRAEKYRKAAKGGDKEAKVHAAVCERMVEALGQGTPVRELTWSQDDERAAAQSAQLITAKKVLYICNVGEEEAATGNAYSALVAKRAQEEGAGSVVLSAAIEAEIAEMDDPTERTDFLEALELTESGLAKLARAVYAVLGLQTYFTAGPKEIRAWTVRVGTTAPEAAGVIHSDFQRGFIRAEVYTIPDIEEHGTEAGLRAAGRLRVEGKDYVVADGDVMHFRFNV